MSDDAHEDLPFRVAHVRYALELSGVIVAATEQAEPELSLLL
jgi:hypothetical protein